MLASGALDAGDAETCLAVLQQHGRDAELAAETWVTGIGAKWMVDTGVRMDR